MHLHHKDQVLILFRGKILFLVKYDMKHLNTLSQCNLVATGGTWITNTVLLQMVKASAVHKCPLYRVAGQRKQQVRVISVLCTVLLDRENTSLRSHSAEE